jgi:phage tail-like protein
MSDTRLTPYLGFNFIVALQSGSGTDFIGGFSDVSGLHTEFTVAEYRNGNAAENHADKLPSIHKAGDVTLKRGVVKNPDINAWIVDMQNRGVAAKRDSVTVTLLDETRQPVVTWTLRSVMPLKWTGPTLAAKGGADVAMEELVLSVEKVEVTYN